MRPKGTSAELERRRRRAVELVAQGESPTVVARILGVRTSSIHRWRRMAQKPHGLDARPVPGPTPRLSDYHLRKLERLLRQGAKKHGWPNELWTADRVARLLRERFGVSFHPEHVRKILKQRLGWTSQKPRRKARERDDKEVERWLGDELPRILREAWKRQAHVVFLDESGFQLTPSVRRTLAPRGQTPVLSCWDRRDRISALSCITLSPRQGRPGLYFELLPVNRTVHAEEVVAFLKALRRQLRGPFTVVWDRHVIHSKSRLVKAFLAEHLDILVEDFPGYVPDLNPDEWVWGWTKYGRLSNLAAWNAEELWDHIVMALIDLKFQPTMLNAFIEEAGIPVAA
ncbi:MAG TPA: IS630 family transposase [Gaiellaceae bacterium]|jgi:transposase|nr:IS630 family transposase [Gaiellaceae bacterium]